MTRSRKVAMVFYSASVCGFAAFGGIYWSRSEFMPYHEEAVGMPWESLPLNTRVLVLALMHTIGVLEIAFGCAIAAMLAIPFRKGEVWADWAIPLVLISSQIATLLIMLEVAEETGAHTPWPLGIAGLTATLVGIVLCTLARFRRASQPEKYRPVKTDLPNERTH